MVAVVRWLQRRRRDERLLELFKLQVVVGGPGDASQELFHAADGPADGAVEGAADAAEAAKAEVGLVRTRPVSLLAHDLFQLLLRVSGVCFPGILIVIPGICLLPGANCGRRGRVGDGPRGDSRQGGVLGGRRRERFLGVLLLLLLRVVLVPDLVHVLRERREIRNNFTEYIGVAAKGLFRVRLM